MEIATIIIATLLVTYTLMSFRRWFQETYRMEKMHFTRRLLGVQKTRFDLEFRRQEIRTIREGVRRQHDTSKENKTFAELHKKTVARFGSKLAEEIKKKGPEFAERTVGDEGYEIVSKYAKIPVYQLKQYQPNADDNKVMESLARTLEACESDLTKIKEQVDDMDRQINDPNQGVNAQIDALNSLEEMLKEHLKKI